MSESREAFVELQSRFDRPGTHLLDRLRQARAGDGGIPADRLRDLADEWGWPVAAVTGAASYYADTTGGPHGHRHVRVCEGTSCVAATGGAHITGVERALGVADGERAADGSVSVQRVRCLGYCYASPAVLDAQTARTGADVDALIGNPPAPPAPQAPPVPYASAVPDPVVLAGLAGGDRPWQVWPEIVATGAADRVRAEITASGLRGRGGAAFPVATKWAAAAAEPAPRYLVVNGDEGDPGSYCDRLLLESDPHRVLEGMALAALAVGANHGLVLVRSEYPVALARVREAVDWARAAGHLGADLHGSGFDFDVDVVEGAGSYVAGEETALLHVLEGLRGEVRSRPPYPTTHGYLRHPTVVNNVETLAAVPWIVRNGGSRYAALGRPDEPGTKLVCLSGLFTRPGVYEVEFGVSLRYLIEDLGGGLRDGRRLRALQIGGPLGGFLTPDQLDLPLLNRPLAAAGAALGHGSLVAIDDTIPAATLLRHVWTFGAAESCGACTPCRVGNRRGLELAERLERAAAAGTAGEVAAAVAAQGPVLDVLAVGSMCAFGRGMAGAVRSLMRVYADELSGKA